MSKIYIILALVLVALAGGLLLLPQSARTDELDPELLFKEINDPARYISVDFVAERLINEDPSIMLVDVRDAAQADKFTLPSAVNIPLFEIAQDEWKDYLDQDEMDVVFYSNGDVSADQAWIICTRLGYKNLYVMSGGLNQWFNDIMQPVSPPPTASSGEFDRYSFRQAASLFFGGGITDAGKGSGQGEPIELIKREKKATTGGGC
jgi:rhodanese-related sulfurtransferase